MESLKQVCYQRWLEADATFQAELVRQHGNRAGDLRYHPDKDDATTKIARQAFLQAAEDWRNV